MARASRKAAVRHDPFLERHHLPAASRLRHRPAMSPRWRDLPLAVLSGAFLAGCGDGAPAPAAPPTDAEPMLADAPPPDATAPEDAPRPDAALAPTDGCAALDGTCDGGVALPGLTELRFSAAIGPNGVSAPVDFTVPARARSVTIVVEGAPDTLLALASLRTADGVERVGLDPAANHGPAMAESYRVEQVGRMAGALYQSVRLGTFTQVYPYRSDQPLPAGATQLRVASTMTSGAVTVRVLVAPEDGARVLHLNVLTVSDALCFAAPPTFVAQMQTIFDQAQIHLVIDRVAALPGTGLNRLTTLTEPQEGPESESAALARLARGRLCSPALNLFVVDSMPTGVAGLSLGTPGPTEPGSYYWGVVIRRATHDGTYARVAAHEVAHFLGLQHVQNVGVSGRVYPDPLDDTAPDPTNLMERGNRLTADQAYTLSRSALLRTQ